MELIADLHLHSKYSRAVSPQMVIPEIAKWAKKKGIDLVGAPDWTHPLWLRELKNDLVEKSSGVYGLRVTSLETESVRFLLSTEISSIYTQNNKSHRIHNLVLAPNFATVDKINEKLRLAGANLFSDGRPIIGLSSIQLAELVFSVSADCLIIPCHAWTPWFSLYGSKSGFDSLSECFGSFSNQIYAIETGLSSDPVMNWRIKELDSRSIVSFSDAHSPAKLGREATVFEIDDLPAGRQGLRYYDITKAIKDQQIAYTIEFYPEEGKYHYTGHRKCNIIQSPEQTEKLGETCPVCGRLLTVGVMHRIEELATRTAQEVETKEKIIGNGVRGIAWNNRPPYVRLVPLIEILAEALNSGISSQKVINEYNMLTDILGSEFEILLAKPLEKIAKTSGDKVAEGIKKVRNGDIVIDPGYDGVFGTVRIWNQKENSSFAKTTEDKQISLF